MTQARKRILIASGGTGGHFYPGLALANELRRKGGWEVLFLVKKDDISIGALAELDYPYAETDMSHLPRTVDPLAHLGFLWRLLRSVLLCLRILKDFRPALVFGTGSYVAFPAVLAAALRGLPSVIHESNARYGLANRLCALFAARTLLGLPIAGNPHGAKSELAGTPVRDAFAAGADPLKALERFGLADGKPVLLVFGGSQGARRLNRAAAAAVKRLADGKVPFQVLHLTGRKDHSSVKAVYGDLGLLGSPSVKLLDYCEDMSQAYAAADLVVCRAGAGTTAELLQLRKPAVMVPFPYSAGGHQLANAKVLADAGAAVLLEETVDLEERLAAAVDRLLGDPAAREELGRNFAKLRLPEPARAAANIAAQIERLISGGTA